jgi:hypothetical protein
VKVFLGPFSCKSSNRIKLVYSKAASFGAAFFQPFSRIL